MTNFLNGVWGIMVIFVLLLVLVGISGGTNRNADLINSGKIKAKEVIYPTKCPDGVIPCRYTIKKYPTKDCSYFIGSGMFVKSFIYVYASSSFGDIGDIVGYTNDSYRVITKYSEVLKK